MRFKFIVEVEVERESGKFASRSDIEAELQEALEGADPSEISGVGSDGDSIYNVVDWAVEPVAS